MGDGVPEINIDPERVHPEAVGGNTLGEEAVALEVGIDHEAVGEGELGEFALDHGGAVIEAFPGEAGAVGGSGHELVKGDGVELGAVVEGAGAAGAGGLEGGEGAAFGGDEEVGRGAAEEAGVVLVEALEEREGLGRAAEEALGGEVEQPGERMLADVAGVEARDAAVAEALGAEAAGGEAAPAAGGVVEAGVEVAQGSGFLRSEGALKGLVDTGVADVKGHGTEESGAG